jgi:hypothetical protein
VTAHAHTSFHHQLGFQCKAFRVLLGGANQISEDDIARASKTSQAVNGAGEKGGKTGVRNRFADMRESGFADRYNQPVVYVNQPVVYVNQPVVYVNQPVVYVNQGDR